jgi:diaminopimelate decarboxylase
MFTSNDTSPEEFKWVAKDGGCILNLDDITFIPLVPAFPKLICFRINPGKERTGGSIIGDPYRSKYGITSDQIIPAYMAARNRGAERFGIHTMICSNELHASYFVDTANSMLEVAALLYKSLGIKAEFINIGGGFGIPYKPKDHALNLEWISQRINKLFEDFASQYGWMPKLLTECGRFVTGPHGILVNSVYHVMQKYRRFIGVAAAMTGCPRPAFYGAYHHIDILTPRGHLRCGPRQLTNVVGPKCENWDRLTAISNTTECPKCWHEKCTSGERLLPKSVKRGDILVTANTGAHSAAMADNYNGRLRLPAVLDLDNTNEHTILIRREETVDDLFRTIMFPSGFNWTT